VALNYPACSHPLGRPAARAGLSPTDPSLSSHGQTFGCAGAKIDAREATWIAIFCHQSVIRIEVVDLVRSHLSSQFTPTVFSFIYLYQDRVDTKLRTMHLLSLIFHLFYSGSRKLEAGRVTHSRELHPPLWPGRASSLCFCPGLSTTPPPCR